MPTADADPTQVISGPAVRGEIEDDIPAVLRDRYVMGSVLGRGGLGVVLSAWDPDLERKVAIKLIRPGAHDGRDRTRATERMLVEAQALAQLSHPNVVSVFDVGTYEISPRELGVFMVMELLEGPALIDWLRTPRPSEEILRVFVLAGRGLAAAHERGLVHRDFKPGNVVLDARGTPKVVDFGLARTGETFGSATAQLDDDLRSGEVHPVGSALGRRVTETGLVMGTPRYMAPEQHAGDTVGPAADQYAFCVALWEALRGRPVFEGETLEALSSAKRERRVAAVSARDRTPPRLVRALERGLDPDPATRWPSMGALLDALATASGRGRRVAPWVAGLAVIGLLGATWAFAPAEGCDPPTGPWTTSAKRDLRDRLATFDATTDTAQAIETRIDERADGISRHFTAACQAHRAGEIDPAQLDRRIACLRAASSELEGVLSILSDADAPAPERALEVIAGLGPLASCGDDVRLAQDLPPPSDPEVVREVARLRADMSRVDTLARAGRGEESKELLARASAEADALGYRPVAVELQLQRAHMEIFAGRYAEAEALLERVLVDAEEIGHDAMAAQAAAGLVFVIGVGQSRFDEALTRAEAAEALIHRAGDPPRTAARLRGAVGSVRLARHEFDQAIAEQEAALALFASMPEPDRGDMTVALGNLAAAMQMKGDLEGAARRQREALAMREEILGESHPRLAVPVLNLANTLGKQGKYAEAEPLYQRAIALLDRGGKPPPQLASPLLGLGVIYKKQGRYDEAAALYERAASVAEAALGPEDEVVTMSMINLANLEKRRGNGERARDLASSAVRKIESRVGDSHPDLASGLADLGDIHAHLGEHDAARRAYERAARILEVSSHTDGTLAHVRVGLGNLALKVGDLDEARESFERARSIYLANGDEDVAYAELGLGEVERRDGDPEKAEALLRAAFEELSGRGDAGSAAEEARVALERVTARGG